MNFHDNRIPGPRAILDNVRSAHNVGSIFRVADCAGLAGLDLCGLTPYPPNEKLTKTALGADQLVRWRRFDDVAEAVLQCRAEGRAIVVCETGGENLFDVTLPLDCAFVVGHEVWGVEPEVVAMADQVVRIPVLGGKCSLNVGTAFAVVAYELYRRSHIGSLAGDRT